MRKLLYVLFFIIIMCIAAQSYAVVIDKLVATVNGEPVTLSELERILQPVYNRYEQMFKGEELEKYKEHARRELLGQLIENKLILQKAKKDGIELTEAALEEQLAEIKEKFGSMEEFEKALEKEGIGIKQYKDELKEQLTIRAMIEREAVSRAKVSPKEIEAYYDNHMEEFEAPVEVHLQHVVIKDTLTKAQEIHRQLKEGKGLENLEDLGFIPKNKMKPELREVIDELMVGQFSEVIESETGYHIVYLKEIKSSDTIQLSEVWDDLEEKIFRKKLTEKHKEWIESLKTKAHIQIIVE